MRRLNQADALAEFQAELRKVASMLGDSISVVDYRARIRHLAVFPVLSAAEWSRETPRGFKGVSNSRYSATAWMWSELTGTPPLSAAALGDRLKHLRAGAYAEFARIDLPVLEPLLSRIAQERLDHVRRLRDEGSIEGLSTARLQKLGSANSRVLREILRDVAVVRTTWQERDQWLQQPREQLGGRSLGEALRVATTPAELDHITSVAATFGMSTDSVRASDDHV